MPTRRGFLASLVAASGLPALTWADAGQPAFLAAARDPDGAFALYGLDGAGAERFRVALPARGHAAAAHPHAPEAIAFARRPGRFAVVLDCVSGRVLRRLEAPAGRHFYGHGAFSADGQQLYTTENDIAGGTGRIGIWARDEGYARTGEIASNGTGPHEMLRLPGRDILVVANGGIRTDPARGRDKLNLDTMRPNLSYLAPDGAVLDMVELAPDLHRNSIRHLAAAADGQVAFAMQWQGDPMQPVPLLGLHRRGQAPALATAPVVEQRAMQGYAGSVALDAARGRVAITSPRGGRVHLFGLDGAYLDTHRRADICGLGVGPEGFVATDGMGGVWTVADGLQPQARFARAWDNHLVTL